MWICKNFFLLCMCHTAMEEVLSRFGHIGDQIFEELDSQTLSKCGIVGESWNLFLDQGKVRPFRIIKTYTNLAEKKLRKYIKKIKVEAVKEYANTLRDVYKRYPQRVRNVNPKNYMDYENTPLHQAAENLSLIHI